jgi:hypothetical protein
MVELGKQGQLLTPESRIQIQVGTLQYTKDLKTNGSVSELTITRKTLASG